MNFLESLKMATTALSSNKLRSSLTMLGIVIGNASTIALVGIGQGAQKLAAEQFEALGPNVLFVVPGSQDERRTSFSLPRTLVWADAIAIKEQVPSVKDTAPQISTNQLITYRSSNTNKQIAGVTPSFLSVRSFTVDNGRFISNIDLKRNNRVVVLGADIADKFFPWDDPIGKQIRIKNISFEIIGIMKAKGSFLGNNQDEIVYIPLSTMANQIVGRTSPYGTQVNFISVSAQDEKSIRAARFQIENLLRLRHKITGKDDFGVQTQKDVLEIVGTVTGALTFLLAAIAGISLLVGGIGLMNIMLVSVTERTSEIGLRKAIGAKKQDIMIQFLLEAIILSAAGGTVGTLIGISGIITVGLFSSLSPVISPVAIVLAVSVSGGIGLFFGVFPARSAAKLEPIVALRTV